MKSTVVRVLGLVADRTSAQVATNKSGKPKLETKLCFKGNVGLSGVLFPYCWIWLTRRETLYWPLGCRHKYTGSAIKWLGRPGLVWTSLKPQIHQKLWWTARRLTASGTHTPVKINAQNNIFKKDVAFWPKVSGDATASKNFCLPVTTIFATKRCEACAKSFGISFRFSALKHAKSLRPESSDRQILTLKYLEIFFYGEDEWWWVFREYVQWAAIDIQW